MWPSLWHTILWCSLETKLKITFFPRRFFGFRSQTSSLGDSIISKDLFARIKRLYLWFRWKRKKRRVERIILKGMWYKNERSWKPIESLPSAPVKSLINRDVIPGGGSSAPLYGPDGVVPPDRGISLRGYMIFINLSYTGSQAVIYGVNEACGRILQTS